MEITGFSDSLPFSLPLRLSIRRALYPWRRITLGSPEESRTEKKQQNEGTINKKNWQKLAVSSRTWPGVVDVRVAC